MSLGGLGTFKTGFPSRDKFGDGCVFITEFKATPLLRAGERDRTSEPSSPEHLKWGVGGISPRKGSEAGGRDGSSWRLLFFPRQGGILSDEGWKAGGTGWTCSGWKEGSVPHLLAPRVGERTGHCSLFWGRSSWASIRGVTRPAGPRTGQGAPSSVDRVAQHTSQGGHLPRGPGKRRPPPPPVGSGCQPWKLLQGGRWGAQGAEQTAGSSGLAA